ncbi:MAG: YihY/virulence factor BrkB family protein [Bdellovibrionaceae bacterium]|nr:YihY/virulence factor BrkB family protein [Pseudobdellovibrionaceae bacterium]
MRDIAKDVYEKLRSGDIRWISSSLAFTTLLSLIPFMALCLVTFKMIGGIDYLVPRIERFLLRYVKEAMGAEVSQWIHLVLEKVQAQTIGTTAVIILFFTSWRLFSDMEKGIQRIWSNDVSRPVHHRFLIIWCALLIFPSMLAVYVGVRSLETVRPLARQYTILMDGLAMFIFLYLVYKMFPADRVLKRVAFIAASFSCICITILQKSFTLIAQKAFYMNKFYGSLAAIPLILFWILGIWQIVLIGTALGSAIQKKILSKQLPT